MTTQLYVVGNKYTVFCGQTPIFSKQVGILMLRIFCVSSQLIAGEDE